MSRALLPSEVEVRKVVLSDQDRPDTKFGAKQNSHTVAWTLVRAQLASLSGKPLATLLDFLSARFGELSMEKSGKAAGSRQPCDHRVDQIRG